MSTPEEFNNCCCAGRQVAKPVAKVKKTAKAIPSVLLSILIAFFPKCPMCWAVYMSMFGSLGLAKLPYMGWLLPVLVFLLAVHLFMLYKKAARTGYLPFIMGLTGAIIMLCSRVLFPFEKWLMVAGMATLISGSLLHSFADRFHSTTKKIQQQ